MLSTTSFVVREHHFWRERWFHHSMIWLTKSGIARVDASVYMIARASRRAAVQASIAAASSGNRSFRSRSCAS
jgi:hypothetical protein